MIKYYIPPITLVKIPKYSQCQSETGEEVTSA